ncbi:MAG: PQQ-dependent sugar dehydrogenase [Kangiellaceae bacterium]|nr:PQQ-dependent sugar dehydrogenase [Kangiellaceae bacterium]
MKINHQLTFLMKITKNAIYRLVSKLEPKARTKAAVFFIAAQFIVHQAIADELKESAFSNYKVSEISTGLVSPWAIAQIGENEFLVTEKSGQLRRIKHGIISAPVNNVPMVFDRSQGGLMDLVLHPNYQQNQWLYLTYAVGYRKKNALRLMRAKLVGETLVEQQVLFTVSPWKDTPVHYGARLTFLSDHSLLLTSGDGFDYRESAQKKDSLLGKVIRLNDDGSIPKDNPFVAQDGTKPEIWSLGHRNAQGIAYDHKRDLVFANEHGPKGGDEINQIEKAYNYGWPIITQGVDYSGALITPFKSYQGMQQPLVDWTPSIAPSSLVVYYGDMFPELNGDLLSTTLKSRELRRVKLDNKNVRFQQSLLTEVDARLRDIMIDSKGALILLTDDGRVIRVAR